MTALWDWVLEAYARPEVEAACLELQDDGGQNVPLLLWALWSHGQGRAPDLTAAAQAARVWDEEAVGPLRRLRRALKALDPDPDREAVRDQVKAVELDAERRLLGSLERLPPLPGRPAAPAEVLLQASAAYGRAVQPSSFGRLLRALNLPTS